MTKRGGDLKRNNFGVLMSDSVSFGATKALAFWDLKYFLILII